MQAHVSRAQALDMLPTADIGSADPVRPWRPEELTRLFMLPWFAYVHFTLKEDGSGHAGPRRLRLTLLSTLISSSWRKG